MFRKQLFVAAGYNTTFFGPGRKEFDPSKPLPPFENYLKEAAQGTLSQLKNPAIDEGIIGSFMSARFIKQANLPGFLPNLIPTLKGKPCTGVEGACGTGGRAIAMAMRSILSDLSDTVFVIGCEFQNAVKSVYGADILAGASYYHGERKTGHAFFFPGIFAERAGAYFKRYGEQDTRKGLAKWYEIAIMNARKNPKAQEYQNTAPDLFKLGLTPPDPKTFLPYLNHFDCSKVSDGASSLIIASKEGLKKLGIDAKNAVEIIGIGEAEGDITKPPEDFTALSTSQIAVHKAFQSSGLTKEEIGLFEVHDCFTISGLLSLEALGLAQAGEAPHYVLDGHTTLQGKSPTNLSGGLCGFGHPTGASGVRQMVDLWQQLTGHAPNQASLKFPTGLMISMGGNDITVTSLVVRAS
jgi:acetyl-CoA C-acetyltransferase/acetyl-CoA acyltransferase